MDYIYPTGGFYGYRYPYGDVSSGIMNQFLTYYSGTYLYLNHAFDTDNTGVNWTKVETWVSYVINTGQLTAITGSSIPLSNYIFPGYYNIGLTNSLSGIYSMTWNSGQPSPNNVDSPLDDPGGSGE